MAHSIILYDNDEVEAIFDDGKAVKLSPCGANVILPVETAPNFHPVSQPEILLQRTKFVTHQHRSQVQAALDFRNRFGEKVFLCRELLDSDSIMEYYVDIKAVNWPSSTSAVVVNPDGSLQLNSIDECASVTLAPNRQELSALFLCKLASEHNRTQGSTLSITKSSASSTKLGRKAYSQRALRDISYTLNFSAEKSEKTESDRQHQTTKSTYGLDDTYCSSKTSNSHENLIHYYVWQVQNHSIAQCPEIWRYPLRILMTKANILKESQDRKAGVMEENMTDEVGGCSSMHRNISLLPTSLPEKCPKSHLHKMSVKEKWEPQMVLSDDVDDVRVGIKRRRIKVCYFKGVIYRVLWHPEPFLEIYPGDGSVLKSMPGEGTYFSYFTVKDDRLQEQILSVKTPPPVNIRCGSHILSFLLKRGNRFLSLMKLIDRNTRGHSEIVCWKDDQDIPLLRHNSLQLVEECNIEGIGHFAAFSNGYLRVKFQDRTIIELQVNAYHNDDDDHDHDDDDHDAYHVQQTRRMRKRQHQLFPENMCRILQPSGDDYMVNLRSSNDTNRYTQVATQWAAWVTLSKEQKLNAYRNNLLDMDKFREVGLELERLRQFNSDMPSHAWTHQVSQDITMSGATIGRLLERNSAKIQDIEDALKES